MPDKRKAPKGHLTVVDWGGGKRWIAKHTNTPDGKPTRKTIGPAWVKPNGKTARGAIKWRAADGSKPEGYLTPAEAEQALDDVLRTKVARVERGTTVVTFGQACDERLRYLEHDKRRKPSTIDDYRNVINHDLIPYFGADKPVAAIATTDVEALKDQMLERVSHRTAQKVLVILYGVMSRAKRKGWITVNPCDDAEKVTLTASDEFNILEPEQVFAVARAATDPMMGALFIVAAFTGLRCPGELIALRWEHVDFANRIVHVLRNFTRGAEGTTKGKRRRSVALADQAFVALDDLSRRDDFTAAGDLVFCTPAGDRLSGDAIRDAFYDALQGAELNSLRYLEPPTADKPGVLREDPIIPYDLRHTFGSLAVRKAPLSDVQAWMGHQEISTTMRYVHYVPQHDAAAKLTAAFAVETTTAAVTVAVPE